MKPYELKENEVFALGVVTVDDVEHSPSCISKSSNQILDIAKGIWEGDGLIWLQVWDLPTGEKVEVEEDAGLDPSEWERV